MHMEVDMKLRKAWRFVITWSDGTQWWGYCPTWAGETLPAGATLKRQRVLTLGVPQQCHWAGCNGKHVPVPSPF